MKKLLALVLALVMTLSLAVVGSNAAFKDADKVKDTYAEAVDVLSGMGVFNGYEDGSFQPEGAITRAEVAAIVYRIYTADVKDKNVSLYEGYGTFTDLAGANWAKGYIGYCANAGLVKGYDAKTFGPADKVTGYQALAMILRAMGYDKNGEFTGTGWELHVAQIAQQLGILKNAGGENLNAPATRQLVAELLFQAIQKPCVTYTPAFGYVANSVVGKQDSLGVKNFGLTKVADTDDKWGRPAYSWTNGKTGSAKVTYATITETPVATYTKAVAECDIAHDAGLKADKTYTLYVNGVKSTDVVQLLDTVGKMGAQGRLTEVYEDRIVMIDTFLAVVTAVKDATYDAQGHLNTPATITLSVYDGSVDANQKKVPSTYVLTNGETNYTYAVGDYVLLNAYTAAGNRTTSTTVTKALGTNVGVYGEIVGKADSVEGTQTVVWYNADKHTVNGTTYDDALKFILDEAGFKTTQHTWFFDSYGNLIGDVEVAAQYNYAVLTKLWWNNIGAEGTGYAMGTLKYMDGSENTVTISKIDGVGTTYAYASDYGFVKINGSATNNAFAVATYPATNAALDNVEGGLDYIHGHLFKVGTLADGTVTLDKVQKEQTVSSATGIVNKLAYIQGATANINIDTKTAFLVRTGDEATGFTYTTYTGMNELPSFKAGAKVDYVLGTNNIAKYVYIIGEPVDATSKSFVLITDKGYSAVLKTTGGVEYYELTLPVPAEDGSVVTMKILKNSNGDALLDQLTSITNVGKLFYVTYKNGYADSAVYVDNYNTDQLGETGYNALHLTDAKMNGTGAFDATVNGSVVCRFNVSSATQIVGTLADDMSNAAGKDVYIIYNEKNNDVSKIYVLDINASKDSSTVTTTSVYANNWATAGVVNGRLDAVTFAATGAGVKADGSADSGIALTATAKWYVREAGTVTFREAVANEVFVSGNTYYAVITIGVPSTATYITTSISPANVITYTGAAAGGAAVTTGTYVTVQTNSFAM